jgi:hypothetical protein
VAIFSLVIHHATAGSMTATLSLQLVEGEGGLAWAEWLAHGAGGSAPALSKPDQWRPFKAGKGSYKFGRTLLFLAAGRLGQLQLLRNNELAPFAATLQVITT